MRRWALLLAVMPSLAAVPLLAADPPAVRVVEFEAIVNPITARRITGSIDDAERAGDALVLVRLDTPGGLVSSMEQIVKRILASRVPVVVWVGPSGAKAASAGFFILLAADVAAMAPGTRTGAASTVFAMGQSAEDNVLLKKSNEDLAALLRSIAERRGRDVRAAEQAVFEAKAYEERIALELGLVDLLAADQDELLRLLDGRKVQRFDGSTVELRTAGARRVATQFSFRHDLMELLAQPAVAYALFMLGLLGIYVEFTHPGVVFPGVAGALCLLLFALSAQVLPVSAIGALLILLAAVMFILEIKVASYGMLSVGGVLSLLLGSLMLIEGPIPELRVPAVVVVPVVLVVASVCILAALLALRAQQVRVDTGVEGLTGEIGTVTEELAPAGKVFVHGEIWNAASTGGPIPRGARVAIERVDGLCLIVGPVAVRPTDRS